MDRQEAEAAFEHPVLTETTLSRAFEDSAARHTDRPAQQYKGGIYERSLVTSGVIPAAPHGEFARLTYGEMRAVVRRLAAGFRDLGVGPDDRIGIFAHTRMEWAQSDFALLAAGAVVTTVYPSSSTDQARYLLGDAGATAVVVENADLLDRVLAIAGDLDLSFAVVMDEYDTAELDVDTGDLTVCTLGDVYERGDGVYDHERYESWQDARDPGDLASLIYTSGTTGQPKGVRLTHRNFRTNVNQCFRRFGPRPDRPAEADVIDEHSTTLSFLPLSHVFERLVGHFLMFAIGACVSYAESPDSLRDDLQQVQPTVLTSVPRVYEKLYAAIREQANEGVKRRLFEWAVDVGQASVEADDPGPFLRAKHALADRLIFAKVRAALGGEMEFPISGGGSLSPGLAKLYHGMGLPVMEGYGLTETAPVVAVNPPDAPKPGTIGPPLTGVETRIDTDADESIPAVDGGEVGELLVRGPNVTDGYWNRPEATERAFTRLESDGEGDEDDDTTPWFRTGDVVERRPDGYLRFRERIKEMLALSTGKKVAPVPIEDALVERNLIEQAMVVGDGRRFVTALLVPSLSTVREWAERENVDLPAEPDAICEDERLQRRIQRAVDRVNDRLEPHERIKRFRLVPEEFTEENGLVTPTLKKKRRKILERHADEIAELYDS